MKTKIAIITIIVLINLSFTINKKDLDVYVCGNSEIYHTARNHQSFNKCTSGIIVMRKSEEKNMGKRHCKCKY